MRYSGPVLIACFAVAALFYGVEAPAQCILANPSFEVGGSGGPVFGGWNQFGDVGSSGDAWHGSTAAVVRGPDAGTWGVSGYWQQQDCVPGEQWETTVQVRHSSTRPLLGQSTAIVNIEWRDSAGDLIDYESHPAALPTSPTDEYNGFSVTSGPAPAGTAATRLLLGVLQSSDDPSPEVVYDQATFFRTSFPTMDDLQWPDFPGGTTLGFAGRTWRVKGPGYYGPGPNHFSDAGESVWVDQDDRLHLTIKNRGGTWYSTEVVLEDTLGYGDYVFTTVGRLDLLDPHAVFGLFLWQYPPCWDDSYGWWNPANEFDIEFSRWGDAGNDLAQFVAQPYSWAGNLSRFDMVFSEGEVTSHAFRWLPDRVECRSWRGGPHDEAPENLVHVWTYTGPHIPRPEQPRVHLNLWQVGGPPATEQEAVLAEFTFVPAGSVSAVPDSDVDTPPIFHGAARLMAATPNPFNPSTTLRFALERGDDVHLAVYDMAGRRVRTLVEGFREAGEHEVVWDGRDHTGSSAASGTYLCVLQACGTVESRRMTLLK
jgi:hypothetical protein